MSIDYKFIYEKVVELHKELISELGKCYLNNRSFEQVLIGFVNHLDFIIYPNTVFTEEGIPIKEIPYEEIN